MTRRGTRIGAAACALGLSLAGPQVTGVASADSPESEPGPTSTGPTAGDTSDATAGSPGIGGPPSRRIARTPNSGPRDSNPRLRPAAVEETTAATAPAASGTPRASITPQPSRIRAEATGKGQSVASAGAAAAQPGAHPETMSSR